MYGVLKLFTIAVLGLSVLTWMVQPSLAQVRNHETHFSIKFGGLEIGKAKFLITFDENSYSLEGSGKTAGLAEWFSKGKGLVKSSGTLDETSLKPEIHYVSVTEKKKTETLNMSFLDDAVDEIELKTVKPRKPKTAPKYVPVEARHLVSVLDPASSIIIPLSGEDARNPRKVCGQTFPIFDGETRYDIKLSYKRTAPVKTKGYDGYAYVCKMKYAPVAGHKKNGKGIKELMANEQMEIWLAPMGGVSVFTPIKILVGTKYGRFSAIPTFFGLVASN